MGAGQAGEDVGVSQSRPATQAEQRGKLLDSLPAMQHPAYETVISESQGRTEQVVRGRVISYFYEKEGAHSDK